MNEDVSRSMTVISCTAYEAATKGSLSTQEAAHLLLERIEIRRFRDILNKFAGDHEVRGILVNGLCANDPSRNRLSIDKKVRGWLSGKYQPTAREDLLELCFVLHLSTEYADTFLTMAGEEGLHWRDPKELVYAYALAHDMNYREAQKLLDRVMPKEKHAGETAPILSFTPLIRQEMQQCSTEEELRLFLSSAAGKLGHLHNTAYRQFMAMLNVLEKPESHGLRSERRYTTREIVKEYLDRKLPSSREGKTLEEKKRSILSDWPDEITLSRMKNRKMDVTRKVLILLFLATDGAEESQEEWSDDEWDEDDLIDDADAMFRSSQMRINQMLADCGYRMLDPRNAFDWLVLYCLRIEDDATSMDGLNERLSHVLEALFPQQPEA